MGRLTSKTAVHNFFNKKISKTAIKDWDDNGEYCVVGKYCIVSLEFNGVIDVWLCNPADLNSGLGQKAVRNRLSAFKSYVTSTVSELTGEGWVKTKDKNLVLDNLSLLGIRKQRQYSPETRKAMAERLKMVRRIRL